MKEAAGEANMTVITIVLIGVVAAVGLLLVPRLMSNLKKKSCCTDSAGIWKDGGCTAAEDITWDEASYNECIAE